MNKIRRTVVIEEGPGSQEGTEESPSPSDPAPSFRDEARGQPERPPVKRVVLRPRHSDDVVEVVSTGTVHIIVDLMNQYPVTSWEEVHDIAELEHTAGPERALRQVAIQRALREEAQLYVRKVSLRTMYDPTYPVEQAEKFRDDIQGALQLLSDDYEYCAVAKRDRDVDSVEMMVRLSRPPLVPVTIPVPGV